MFFLDCGAGCFAVTAAHVYEGYLAAKGAQARLVCQVGDVSFDPAAALIDCDLDIDIATFRFSAEQVQEAGKVVLTGCQPSWPPYTPQVDRGVVFAGFPGIERRWIARRAINWGIYTGGTVASSVSERDVSCAFERDHWIDVMGTGLPPEGYDMGGISGGPMLMIVERGGLRSYCLAGVVYQGPNPDGIDGFEAVRARRAHFILPDGRLDRSRWI